MLKAGRCNGFIRVCFGLPAVLLTASLLLSNPAQPDSGQCSLAASDGKLAGAGCMLFFDPRLSSGGRLSCATCHVPVKAFQDGYPRALSVGTLLPRNTPSLLNASFYSSFPWDGKFQTVPEQIHAVLFSQAEMNSNIGILAEAVNGNPTLAEIWDHKNPTTATAADFIQSALGEYIKSIATKEILLGAMLVSPEVGTKVRRGQEVFFASGCATCHPPPTYTDNLYHNVGLTKIPTIVQTDRTKPPHLSFSLGYDYGRGNVVDGTDAQYAFRTPSLINVATTAPYMHDGRFATLDEVLSFYERGSDQSSADGVRRQEWSREDREALKAFFDALTDVRFVYLLR